MECLCSEVMVLTVKRKDVDDFAFKDTPINEAVVRDLAGGSFIDQQRSVVLVGGTGSRKTHLAIAIARSCIHAGSRGRFFTTVDLVNRLEAAARAGRQDRIADYLTRMDFVRPGRRTAPLPPRQPALRANLDSGHHQSRLRRMAKRVRRSKDEDRAARPPHPSLRYRRNRQRELALQEPRPSVVCDRDFVTSRFGVDHATQIDRRAIDDRCRAPGALSCCSASGTPPVRIRRPLDHRSRAKRWSDAISKLTTL